MVSSSKGAAFYRTWAEKNRWSEDLMCGCDEPATFSISRTESNPGRKFRGCPNYQDKFKKCDFFIWVDPPLPNNHYRETMWKLYEELDKENAATKQVEWIVKMLKVIVVMMVFLVVMLIVCVIMLRQLLNG